MENDTPLNGPGTPDVPGDASMVITEDQAETVVNTQPETPETTGDQQSEERPTPQPNVHGDMKCFVGTKVIMAAPMARGEYSEYRGWNVPDDEDPEDEGFLVEYVDGGASNHPDHEGYISWSPSEVFENAYQPISRMSFGHAMIFLEQGRCISRRAWHDKNARLRVHRGQLDFITSNGTPEAWRADYDSLRANDWYVVDD